MPDKPKTGRPLGSVKPIDLEEVEKLASWMCTDEDMATACKMTRENFTRRKNKSRDILDAIERGRAKGRTSLRRAQFAAALKGNATMLVWMGKQLLGQKDIVTNEHTGDITIISQPKALLLRKLAQITTAPTTDSTDQLVN